MVVVVLVFALVGGSLTYFISAQTRYFNPGRETSRQAAAAFLYRAEGSPSVANSQCGGNQRGPFRDVPSNHPFCEEIEWMAQEGISTGYSDGTFRPGQAVSRQAMAVFIHRAAGSPSVSNSQCGSNQSGPFNDVDGGHQFCEAIDWMRHAGITEGYGDGTFRPSGSTSRQAAAAFVHRANNSPNPTGSSNAFSDVPPNHQFYDAIQWLGEEGLAEGHREQRPDRIEDTPDETATPSDDDVDENEDISRPQTTEHPTEEEDSTPSEDEDTAAPRSYFNPGREISRQAMMIFIHRSQGEPTADNELCQNGESPVRDVSADSEFCGAVNWAIDSGVTEPHSGNRYRPASPTSRQSAAAFIYRLDAENSENFESDNCGEEADGPFEDVSGTHRFCEEIDFARSSGIIEGYDDGTFRPRDSVSRQAAAAFIHRMADEPSPATTEQRFVDVPPEHQFYNAIQWLGEEEVTTGSSEQRPNKIDLLSGHELGQNVKQPELVVNLQTRLQKLGFDDFIDVDGSFDENTAFIVKMWQGEQGFEQTGIFNATQHLERLQQNERPVSAGGWRFDSEALKKYLQAVHDNQIENDRLYGQNLCLNAGRITSNSDARELFQIKGVISNLQNRLKAMGFRVSTTGVYDTATRDAVQWWRATRYSGSTGGCFPSDRVLEEFRRDERRGYKVDMDEVEAALGFAAATERAKAERERRQAAAAEAGRDPLDVPGLLLCHGAGGPGRPGFDEIRNLQSRFNQRGMHPPLAVDGIVGDRTRAAIMLYKSARNIDGRNPTCWNDTDYQNLRHAERSGWSFAPILRYLHGAAAAAQAEAAAAAAAAAAPAPTPSGDDGGHGTAGGGGRDKGGEGTPSYEHPARASATCHIYYIDGREQRRTVNYSSSERCYNMAQAMEADWVQQGRHRLTRVVWGRNTIEEPTGLCQGPNPDNRSMASVTFAECRNEAADARGRIMDSNYTWRTNPVR